LKNKLKNVKLTYIDSKLNPYAEGIQEIEANDDLISEYSDFQFPDLTLKLVDGDVRLAQDLATLDCTKKEAQKWRIDNFLVRI